MRAIRVEEHGGPEVLKLKDIPIGDPGPGQAIVKMMAAGVNFMDVGHRRGSYPREVPFTPGAEGSGIVESVGEGVTCVQVGERVVFAGQPGAYAQAIRVEADRLIPLPPGFSFEQGAAFPLQGITAQYVISEFRPKSGDCVLVHAAAGGVGGWLVQWARHLGATVIGTVSSEAKARKARELGAEHVIRYTEEDFVGETLRITGGRGADVIFDGVGSTLPGDLAAVAVRGSIVLFGASGGSVDPVAPHALMPRSVSLCGASLAHLRSREELLSRAGEVIGALTGGWLKLSIGGVLPLEQAHRAHQQLESRDSHGKWVLTVAR